MLALRRSIKAKKPKFTRQDSHKRKRLKEKWRKPKGLQSKMKYSLPGYKKPLEVGYGSPAEVKGLTRDGFVPVRVSNLKELSKIEEGEGALISSTVGQRKKAEILKKAKDMSIKVLNIKDIDAYLKLVEEKIEKKKAEKEKTAKEKEKKKAEKEKKAKEGKKEDLAEKLTDEEKKTEEKKEREKILTKKEK
ncbi:50S ribosomal protein L32e [Candidatus Woesearchaeota archaeon]|nr:50S ribosomal protein L32e [Candidatus Woesearchaeota archaeon]